MTRIDKTGWYKLYNGQTAKIESIVNGFAIGFVEDKLPLAWVCFTGRPWTYNPSKYWNAREFEVVQFVRSSPPHVIDFKMAMIKTMSGDIDVVWMKDAGSGEILAVKEFTITEGEGVE